LSTRNRQSLLKRALLSLRSQTYRAVEILVLDDGSTDATPDFLERIAQQDPRVRWLRREQSRGLASALNALIGRSRGNWLARMDDDDIAHPQRIARQLAYMQEKELDVCDTWYRRRAGWRRSIARPAVEHGRILGELLFQPPLLHPSVMFRRTVFERFGGYSETAPHAEDYELWVRLMGHVRFGNCPEILMDYTLSPAQISRHYNAKQVETARSLRIRALAQLAIRHTPAQAAIHAQLRDPSPIRTLDELERIHDWLLTLFPQLHPEAQTVVQRQWFLQCVRAAGLGPVVFQRFRSSPLAKVGAGQQGALWVLCKSRLKYRSRLYNQLEPLAKIG